MKASILFAMGVLVVSTLGLSACGNSDSNKKENALASCPSQLNGASLTVVRSGGAKETFTFAADTYAGKNTSLKDVAGQYTYSRTETSATLKLKESKPSTTAVYLFEIDCSTSGNPFVLTRSFSDSPIAFGDSGTVRF